MGHDIHTGPHTVHSHNSVPCGSERGVWCRDRPKTTPYPSSRLFAIQPVRPRQHATVRPPGLHSACRQSANLALAQARAANRPLAHGTRTNRICQIAFMSISLRVAPTPHSSFVTCPRHHRNHSGLIIMIGLRLVMDGVHTSQWPWPSQGCEDRRGEVCVHGHPCVRDGHRDRTPALLVPQPPNHIRLLFCPSRANQPPPTWVLLILHHHPVALSPHT